ncbi:transposase, partial [Streptomyces sp. NPDC001982]|uniref:transposase n=1 Tax=Streptomyces sp. NPDC001982 TaxID=3154405 RepID=UPI00331BFBD9
DTAGGTSRSKTGGEFTGRINRAIMHGHLWSPSYFSASCGGAPLTMAYNLLRATGALASAFHAKATTATLRAHLIHVPARIARSARRITLHLPHNWPCQQAWTHLFDTVHGPPELV